MASRTNTRGVGALPLGIAGREVGSDIAGGNGAEQRVGERVQQDVAVGVAGEAAVMRQRTPPIFSGMPGLNSCESQP